MRRRLAGELGAACGRAPSWAGGVGKRRAGKKEKKGGRGRLRKGGRARAKNTKTRSLPAAAPRLCPLFPFSRPHGDHRLNTCSRLERVPLDAPAFPLSHPARPCPHTARGWGAGGGCVTPVVTPLTLSPVWAWCWAGRAPPVADIAAPTAAAAPVGTVGDQAQHRVFSGPGEGGGGAEI